MTKKLSDSAIFQKYNPKIINNLKNINPLTDSVSKEKLEEPLNFINKKFNFSTKNKIMNYLNKNEIIIVMNDDYQLPRFLNVFGKMHNGKPVVLVDISAYVNSSKSVDNINIYPKILYSLLQNAMILLEITKNPKKFINNFNLVFYSTISYSKLICQVLDKILGININKARSDIFYFLVGKFFLKEVVGYEGSEDEINKIAYKCILNDSNLDFLLEMESTLNTDILYDNFFSFFNELSTLEGASSLKSRGFIEQYLRMYGEASMLSMDYFPAFLNLILGTNVSAQINKDYIIDSVASRSNAKINIEFSKLI